MNCISVGFTVAGVIARGTVRVSLQPAAAAARHRREHAYRMAWPLLPVFLVPQPLPSTAAAPAAAQIERPVLRVKESHHHYHVRGSGLADLSASACSSMLLAGDTCSVTRQQTPFLGGYDDVAGMRMCAGATAAALLDVARRQGAAAASAHHELVRRRRHSHLPPRARFRGEKMCPKC